MLKLLSREPVLAAATAVVLASLGLLAAFGVHVTTDVRDAVVLWIQAVGGLAFVVRSQVTPTGKLSPPVQVNQQSLPPRMPYGKPTVIREPEPLDPELPSAPPLGTSVETVTAP